MTGGEKLLLYERSDFFNDCKLQKGMFSLL